MGDRVDKVGGSSAFGSLAQRSELILFLLAAAPRRTNARLLQLRERDGNRTRLYVTPTRQRSFCSGEKSVSPTPKSDLSHAPHSAGR